MSTFQTRTIAFPLIEAPLHSEGATPMGYPIFGVHWPRVGRIRGAEVYVDHRGLRAVADSLNRPESYYRHIPDHMRMALWRADAPQEILEREVRGCWVWDILRRSEVFAAVVRYDSVGKGEDRQGVMHTVYVPKELFNAKKYPAELLSILREENGRADNRIVSFD